MGSGDGDEGYGFARRRDSVHKKVGRRSAVPPGPVPSRKLHPAYPPVASEQRSPWVWLLVGVLLGVGGTLLTASFWLPETTSRQIATIDDEGLVSRSDEGSPDDGETPVVVASSTPAVEPSDPAAASDVPDQAGDEQALGDEDPSDQPATPAVDENAFAAADASDEPADRERDADDPAPPAADAEDETAPLADDGLIPALPPGTGSREAGPSDTDAAEEALAALAAANRPSEEAAPGPGLSVDARAEELALSERLLSENPGAPSDQATPITAPANETPLESVDDTADDEIASTVDEQPADDERLDPAAIGPAIDQPRREELPPRIRQALLASEGERPPAQSTNTGRLYRVQLAAVDNEVAARIYWREANARLPGVFADVEPIFDQRLVDERLYLRIWVGAFSDRNDALGYCAWLKDQGQDCFVTRVDNF